MIVVLTIQSTIHVPGLTGREVTGFLLTCTDETYRAWWPGTHLRLHALRVSGRPDHVGDRVLMDEYIGARRVRMTGVVAEAVPGRLIVWQLVAAGVPLPVRLMLELTGDGDGVGLQHTIRAGFRGVGRMLDPLIRLYFSARFAAAMDQHVRTEFPMLRDRLVTARPGNGASSGDRLPGAPWPPHGR